jgi:hypothetical protein
VSGPFGLAWAFPWSLARIERPRFLPVFRAFFKRDEAGPKITADCSSS